jgi:hypothetical protein
VEKSKFGIAVRGLKQKGEHHDCLIMDPATNESRLFDTREEAEKFVKNLRENAPDYLCSAFALLGIPLKFDVVELLSRKKVATQNPENEFRKRIQKMNCGSPSNENYDHEG